MGLQGGCMEGLERGVNNLYAPTPHTHMDIHIVITWPSPLNFWPQHQIIQSHVTCRPSSPQFIWHFLAASSNTAYNAYSTQWVVCGIPGSPWVFSLSSLRMYSTDRRTDRQMQCAANGRLDGPTDRHNKTASLLRFTCVQRDWPIPVGA